MAGTPPASPSGLVTRCVAVQVQLKGAGAGVIRCRTTGRRWNQVQANSPGAPDATNMGEVQIFHVSGEGGGQRVQ